MSDDLLLEATRAVRESTGSESAGAAFTRARVMATLHQQRRRRVTRRALLLPVAAILVGSTAWAAASGKLGEAMQRITQAVLRSEEPRPVARAVVPLVARRAASRPLPAAVPSTAREAEPAPAEPEVKRPERVAPSVVPSAEPANPPPSSEEQLLYRAAHRAHFTAHDWAGALRAWDAYLALAPQGRFVPEARYNRALCLVRLGRRSDAEHALEPFARGQFGAYRQREAKALLDAMEAADAQ